LSGIDNIHNEAHYVASNIPIFEKLLNLFLASINICSLSSAGSIIGQGGGRK